MEVDSPAFPRRVPDLLPVAPPPSPALLAAVAAAGLVRTRRPLRALFAVAALGIVWATLLLVWCYGFRDDVGRLSLFRVGLCVGAGLAAFVTQLAGAIVPGRGQVLAAPRGVLRTLALGLLLAATGLLLSGRAPSTSPPLDASVAHYALPCIVNGLGVLAVPTAAALLAVRRHVPIRARSVAMAIGAGTGALSGLVLHLGCRVGGVAHFGLIHGGMMVAPGLLLAVLAPRLLR